MREYIGKERVDDALRSLLKKHGSGVPPFPTSLDLYRELQAVTPDSYQSLLRDLFEKNTFWDLATERATAKQTSADAWQVTLDVRARKVVVDEAGIETEAPMDDWVVVGVFGEGEPYRETHRIRSGQQTHHGDRAAQAHARRNRPGEPADRSGHGGQHQGRED